MAPTTDQSSFPDHPIVVVAPFPPGHVSDLQPRLMAPHLSAAIGQPVNVENWTGASGTAALERLKAAAPDGYTIIVHGVGGLAITAHLLEVGYDPVADFTPITKLVSAPMVLVATSSLPVATVQEFVAYAKAHPDKVKGGSFGNGTNSHLALILFNRSAGLEISHTPYPGGEETMTDLVAGRFHVMFDFPPVVRPHLAAGRLKALGLTGDKRPRIALPDVPTLAEAGITGVDITGWQGVLDPKRLPEQVLSRLNAVFGAVQELPEVKNAREADGYILEAGTPEEFGRLIKDEHERWGALIRAEGIRAGTR
jgi:tripartite-type tricarboxylate transporter receptor subunit TctC